jgi:hypothetical protein
VALIKNATSCPKVQVLWNSKDYKCPSAWIAKLNSHRCFQSERATCHSLPETCVPLPVSLFLAWHALSLCLSLLTHPS